METATKIKKNIDIHFIIKMSYCNSVQSTLILFKRTKNHYVAFLYSNLMGYGILVAMETKKKKKRFGF